MKKVLSVLLVLAMLASFSTLCFAVPRIEPAEGGTVEYLGEGIDMFGDPADIFKATANEGYIFVGWKGDYNIDDIISTDETIEIPFEDDTRCYAAVFKRIDSGDSSGDGGSSDSGSSDSGSTNGFLSFFQRIIQWFKDLFAKIFKR